MTTPADELRTAAQRLRELATDATDGPWTPDDPNTRWGDDGDHQLVGGGKILATFDSDYNGPLNTAYAAAMHPGVGTALADWLETEARVDTEDQAALRAEGRSPEEEHQSCTVAMCTTKAALAVARLINQERQ